MTNPSRAFILMIGDDGALLLPPRRAENAAPLFAATHDEQALAPLLAALAASPRTPILLLADILAQEYKREVLPPVSFFDRRKLLAKRLAQAFPKTTLRLALPCAQDSALLVGVDEKSPVGWWLDRLASLPHPLAGISLLPIESARFLPKLDPAATQGWAAYLAAHQTGGFRQIVTQNGEIVFTRLTPPFSPLAHPDTIAESLAQDLQATRAYLARCGLDADAPLSLTAILPPAWHDSFQRQEMPVTRRFLFSPAQAAASLSLFLPLGPKGEMADLIPALWLQAQTRPRALLMPPAIREKQRNECLARIEKNVALAALIFALSFAAASGATLWTLARAGKAARTEISALQTRIETSREDLLREASSLDLLRKAVERRRLFSAEKDGPETLVPLLDAALGAGARLESLDWKPGVLTFEARLREEGLSRQETTQRFDELTEALKETMTGMSVSVSHYPYPSLPGETITNKDSGKKETPPAATYLLRKEGL